MTARLTLGVMGHVDHGKTALVRALTGQDTDRLPEEKRRGVSIALGFAHAQFGAAEVDFIDMPGHERFVRTLVSGATGVDAALLAVAANEGVKPQTLEHLEIAARLGLDRIVIVVTKGDLATEAQAQVVAEAAAEAVRGVGLEAILTPAVSIRDGRGLAALEQQLAALAAAAPARADDGFAWLPVDRAFTVPGHGTVVTGTLRRGELRADAALALAPDGRAVRVRGLQVHGRAAETAQPGQRVAVNLRGVEPASVPRGTALVSPGVLAVGRWLSVTVSAAADGLKLTNGMALRLLFGAAEMDVRLRLLDRDAVQPGDAALAQLDCAEPVAVPARERFVLRLASPPRTVGGGVVLDPAARRLRRRDPLTLARLAPLQNASLPQIVTSALNHAGPAGVRLDRLSQLSGLSPARAVALTAGAEDAAGVFVTSPALAAVQARLRGALAEQMLAQPNGVPRRRLATLVPDASPEVLACAVDRLIAAGVVRTTGGGVELAPPRAVADARARQADGVAAALLDRLRAGGLSPPDVQALAPTPLARRILDQLARDGRAVHTLDRVQKREVYFHPDAVAAAKARLRPELKGAGLTTGEAGALLGATRKFSVPLLEYLDTVRFTRRQGDRRTLGPAAES